MPQLAVSHRTGSERARPQEVTKRITRLQPGGAAYDSPEPALSEAEGT
jgi:hypothetical protein